MSKNKIYTKEELMDLTVPNISKIELYSKIDPKGLKKEEIIDAMIKFQEENPIEPIEEVIDNGAEAPIENETTEEEDDSDKNETDNSDSNDEGNDDEEPVKSEKVVFHRGRNKTRNRMTFR